MAGGPAGHETLRGALARFADALLGLLRTRIELVAVEYTEERDRVVQHLTLLVAGLGCLLFALLFAAIAVVAYFWDTYRITSILGGGGVLRRDRRGAPLAAHGSVPDVPGTLRGQRGGAREGPRGDRPHDEPAAFVMTTDADLTERKARLIAQSDLHRMQALLAWHAARRVVAPPAPADRSHASRSVATALIGIALPLFGAGRMRGALRTLSTIATVLRVWRAWRARG